MKTSTVAGGRIAVYAPDHPASNNRGYILRSRYVMEKKLGRRLDPDEEVHHKNENKYDDDPSNLVVLSKSDHAKLHVEDRKGFGDRKLDYDLLKSLRSKGLGYKKIAQATGYPVSSVKSAVRILERG